MTIDEQALEEYRLEIERCAQALALAQNDAVSGKIPAGQAAAWVKMFTDGNLDKRFEKIKDQIEYFDEVFPDLEDRIVKYVRTIPLAAYDTGCSDTDNFLSFLEAQGPLDKAQRDHVACQRSRHAVEFLATHRRMEHVRFQELLASVERFAVDLGENPDLWIHLNPVRTWTKFSTTTLLDADDETPAHVVFFPVTNDIRTAVLEPEGLEIISALEEITPCKIDASPLQELLVDLEDRVEFLTSLAQLGLVAFG